MLTANDKRRATQCSAVEKQTDKANLYFHVCTTGDYLTPPVYLSLFFFFSFFFNEKFSYDSLMNRCFSSLCSFLFLVMRCIDNKLRKLYETYQVYALRVC